MENIRVLIIDDNATKANNLSRLLQFEADIKVQGTAESGEGGLEQYQELEPDVVLMDRTLPDMDGFAATKMIIEHDPFAQVVFSGLEPDAKQAQEAMDAGAAYFLVSPIDTEKLVSAVRKAAQRRETFKGATGPLMPPEDFAEFERNHRPLGKVITIYSGKGGVGCTMIATNLAIALQSDETPAVLVDADLQYGDVTALLNLQPIYTMADIATQTMELDDDLIGEVLLQHSSGLRILSAPKRPEQGEEVTAEGFIKVLDRLKMLFAYVVIDTSSNLDDISLTALEASDQIVSVAEPDIPAIKNTRFFLDALQELGIPRDRVLLVLNKVDRRDLIRADDVEKNLKHEIAVEIPNDRVGVKNSINKGIPLLIDGKTHPIVQSLLELVGEIKERVIQEKERD